MTTEPKNVATLDTDISTPNEIVRYMHCSKCIEQIPPGQSPEKWARISTGITMKGVQVWCVRHSVNIALLEWA